jgi:S-disulfanyl-L-cysteine oxidoreductase SoxD
MFMRKYLFWLFLIFVSGIMADTATPNLGKPAPKALIDAWDTDIFPDGSGLPSGQGTVSQGKLDYEMYCQACHGPEGTGGSADELAGAKHGLTDNPPDKTIGTYWPYATTIFDFTRRAMPLNNPGILTNDQLYAVTAYLLHLNNLLNIDTVLSAQNLAKIQMPNRDGFINAYKMPK